ncbi:Elongation of very long chain fatty acids protein [Frankliniella fusca]|uniref:Elongation of very long chain fatty acids protein n=1 Tax=Frankliniella fusca TaxID=407009 RepID=A0AAE1I353_9NEOP|nr:Elongation of very long chain fatty acids protein [Frankliniella fusca]
MSHVVKFVVDGATFFVNGFWSYAGCAPEADPRTEHLPMVKNPLPVMAILGAYLYFALSLGPRLMKHREPFNLKKIMLFYNAAQVIWCSFLIRECVRLGWGWSLNWTCMPLGDSREQVDYEIALAVWLYFILKIVDLLDTVFMVLRKNFHQISFLHVYHHTGMVCAIWFAVKVIPGAHHTFLGFINCFVHCFLYAYYFISLLVPSVKSAWWKKYITLVQLVQFGMIALHELLPFIITNCAVDRRISGPLLAQNLFMFALFSEFYFRKYVQLGHKNKKN